MTDQPLQPRKTIKLKPISKAPGSSIGASASAPVPVAPTIQSESFGDAPTVKLSPQSIINPPPVPVAPMVPAASVEQDQPMLESTHTGTQPLKKMPTVHTQPGTLIPQDFGNKMALGGDKTVVAPGVGQTMPSMPAMTAIPGVQEDESTQKIATAAKAVAKPQQQTIKLRPSTASAPAVPGVDTSIPGAHTIKLGADQATPAPTPAPGSGATIKLVPTATVTETAAIKPSAPTIKLSPTQQTPVPGGEVKPSAPTIKLTAGSQTTKAEPVPVTPGGQTIQLSPEAQAAGMEEAHPQKTKLVIKKQEPSASMAEMHEGQLSPGGEPVLETGEKADEPSLIFTLVAVFSMLIAGYLFFMGAAQYANHWMGKSLPLPGISINK